MLFRRLFKRRRTRSSNELIKQTCLCTTAKRDSLYDDVSLAWPQNEEISAAERYGFSRTDKPRRLMRQTNIDDSDKEDEMSITEKLRRASAQNPANIPMLVVVGFHPDAKGLSKKQIEIQRGFPVNAQYIVNEWLFIKTADNDEGFVPYLCCRPIFRRISSKSSNPMDNSYKLYDFETNGYTSRKSLVNQLPMLTPPAKKKLSVLSPINSQSYLSSNSSSQKKRGDVTSSSCGGDSGVSDCESSSHHPQSVDIGIQRSNRLSHLRASRSSSSSSKSKQPAVTAASTIGLVVQDLPLKSSLANQSNSILRTDEFHPIKSQLPISSNSAFTQIIKKNPRAESYQRRAISPLSRSYHHDNEMLSTTLKSHLVRASESSDEMTNLSSPSMKCLLDDSSSISSPYIRRTPFVRRSLPHQNQSILKKTNFSKSASSPDPFKKAKNSTTRHLVFVDPTISSVMMPSKTTKMERHFSDLSLNQIENDCLITPLTITRTRAPVSCSSASSNTTTCSSASSADDCPTPFIHIQRTNYLTERKATHYASSSIPTNSKTVPSKSTSFIHNVSITV